MERTYWAAKVIGASSQWDERGKRKKGTEEGWGWVTRNAVEATQKVNVGEQLRDRTDQLGAASVGQETNDPWN